MEHGIVLAGWVNLTIEQFSPFRLYLDRLANGLIISITHRVGEKSETGKGVGVGLSVYNKRPRDVLPFK